MEPHPKENSDIQTENMGPADSDRVENEGANGSAPADSATTEPEIAVKTESENTIEQNINHANAPAENGSDGQNENGNENGNGNGNGNENENGKDAQSQSQNSLKRRHSDDNGTKRRRQEPLVVVPPKKPALFYSPLKTGLVYDVRMRYHAKIFTLYFEYIDPHPEDPRRIYRIYKKLAEAGLIQDSTLAGADELGPLICKIPIREATAEEILQVHTEKHLQFIAATEDMTRAQLLDETEKGDSIYVNNDSFLLAKLSCGGAIEACKAVVEGHVKNAMAIVRPPGHHAEPDAPGGFCLFSNVAVAAKNMLRAYPESVRRIAIVDWDIHHGNGTQRAFYDDPRVLYVLLHRYENGRFYPGTKFGGADQTGSGKGAGFSLNIPWPSAGVGDADYVYAFRRVVLPVLCEFDPDLVIVSAGFDAAAGDLIGQCHVTPAGYGHMTHMLKGVARGKLAVVLEGGYNLESISASAVGVAKVLVGEPPEEPVRALPRADVIETIGAVVRAHAPFWQCMRAGAAAHVLADVPESAGAGDAAAEPVRTLAEPVRAHQAAELFARHGFVPLPVLPDGFSEMPPHADELVLASPDIADCPTVMVCVHDPPEVWADVNAVSGTIESGLSVILEHPLARIMARMLAELDEKIGYIDICIPEGYGVFAQELLLWVWDNYVSYFSAKKAVFVGYGDAHQAVVHLLAKRPANELREVVRASVAFVNALPLKPLVPVMDESMVDWYYQNSLIFASRTNACWAGAKDEDKRPRKKFGRVLKAAGDGLWEVIHERFDEGVDFLLDLVGDFSDSE